jgi:predicted dehydrogenase
MLGEQALDVLAICSPPAAHRAALLAALEAGVHVLCEKPLWWEADSARRAGLAARSRRWRAASPSAGGCSRSTRSGPPRCRHSGGCTRRPRKRACGTFRMLLSPRGDAPGQLAERVRRERLVIDAAPHAISLLQALVGHGRVEAASASVPAGATRVRARAGASRPST